MIECAVPASPDLARLQHAAVNLPPDNADDARYMNIARPVRAFGVEERMTGTTRSSNGLDTRRRKLLFRAWHRGIREMDLIMGGFADRNIERMSDPDLDEFENLMTLPDAELLAWLTSETEVPAAHDGPLFRQLRAFRLQTGAQ
jgi:antitoxin CptB